MKKTMFITSVIMVVVMAIALTTSSLAWFNASGASTVTTETLSVRAKADASSGIQITDDSTLAVSSLTGSISLYTNDAYGSGANSDNTGMIPLLPYKATSSDSILTALSSANFIWNKVDENGNFVNTNATTGSITSGAMDYFMTDNVYITNMAQGSGAEAVYIQADISFLKNNAAYSYTGDNRRDPELIVAVLADTNKKLQADGTDDGQAVSWEIISVASSRGASSIQFGKVASEFASTKPSGSCATTLTIASDIYQTANKKTFADGSNNANVDRVVTSTAIAPIGVDATDGTYRPFGEVKQFRVIAWYAGDTLVNSNSGTTLQFAISFSAHNASAIVS